MGLARFLLLCATLSLMPACTVLDRIKPEPEPAPQAKPISPPTPEQAIKAFTLLNKAFQDAYERILDERGTRTVSVQRADAFEALEAGLRRLGMIVESRDPEAGTLTVAAPAPRPLSADEWRRVAESDAQLMAGITCPILGEYCRTIRFEPDDYVIVINATVLGTANSGSRISLTTRMREIAPRPGFPRRDYPPPTGVRLALDKIWGQFEQQMRAAGKIP